MTSSKILGVFTVVGLCITSVLGTPVFIDTGDVLSRRETSLFAKPDTGELHGSPATNHYCYRRIRVASEGSLRLSDYR